VENIFVIVRRSLSADEHRDINSLFVETGKIGGFVRSRGKSEVWDLELIGPIINYI